MANLPPTRVTGAARSAGESSVDPFASRLGEVVGGKWQLDELLGVGGMGAVYGARHCVAKNRVAVKILHPEVARNAEARQRFEQEAHAVARLRHPGVVEIFDIDVSERGEAFLVMERLSGESLSARRRAGPLEGDELLGAIDQTLEVLVDAHAMGIVHRDIKPDNLFLTESGRLKVLDFGIARVRHESAMRVRTATGVALATVSYAPPEQLTGVGVDHRADIFALGATMFELASGRTVHTATTEQQLLVKMMTEPAPPLASVAPDVPAPIASIVDRALAFAADDRYPDAATMLADVRAVRAGGAPPFASAAPPLAPVAAVTAQQDPVTHVQPPRNASSRRVMWVAALGVFAGISLVLLFVLALGDDAETTSTHRDLPARDVAEEDEDRSSSRGYGPATIGDTSEQQKKQAEKARENEKREEEKARENKKREEEKKRDEKGRKGRGR
jgi:eukaryotic-like serine/threonine-protein kinase